MLGSLSAHYERACKSSGCRKQSDRWHNYSSRDVCWLAQVDTILDFLDEQDSNWACEG